MWKPSPGETELRGSPRPLLTADGLFSSLPRSEQCHQAATQDKGPTAWEALRLLPTSVISQSSSPAPPAYPVNILYWSLSQAIYLHGEDKILRLKLLIRSHRGYFCSLTKGKSLEAQPPFSPSNTQRLPHAGSWPEPLESSFCPSDSELNVIINPAFSLPGQRECCLFPALNSALGPSHRLRHPLAIGPLPPLPPSSPKSF